MGATQKSGSSARAQVVTPRSSRRIKRARSRQSPLSAVGDLLESASVFIKPAAVVLLLLLMIYGYNAVAGSRLFELSRVEVNTASADLRKDVEATVRRAVGQSKLLDIDLDAVRQKVTALARVRSATVARALPDQISVHVIERQPALLARRESGQLVWLDDDGVEMGDISDFRSDESGGESGERAVIPPIAKGLSEGKRTPAAVADDRERVAIYRQIENEFQKEPNPVWSLVDEIDLTFTKDVNMRLANSSVTVHVGGQDFRNRFETAIQVLAAIKQGDSELLSRFRIQDPDRLIENADNINFIDVARSDRIVLNFSSPGREKARVRQETEKVAGDKAKSKARKAKAD